MFTLFTMFIYITIMIKSFYILLIISSLVLVFNSCTSTKSSSNDKNQEHEIEKKQEAFEENYERHH